MDEVAKRIEEITDMNGGVLRPEAVVEDAKDPKSPLHAHFEWDNEKCGYHWRLRQARKLIRRVRVEVVTTTKTIGRVPVYVKNPTAPKAVAGYVRVSHLSKDELASRRAVRFELSEALRRIDRAERIAEGLGVTDEVSRWLNDLRKHRKAIALLGDEADDLAVSAEG